MSTASPEFLTLLNEHQPLLRRVARLYCPDAADRQDLYQELCCTCGGPTPATRPDAKLST